MADSPTLPTYSHVSSRTLERICTAVANHQDPFKAANTFEKNPVKSWFNDAWTWLGFTDLYADQEKEKAAFVCAVLGAVHGLAHHSNHQAEETFNVSDARGLEHKCTLTKNTDGEIELVGVSTFPFVNTTYTYNRDQVAHMEMIAEQAAKQVQHQFFPGIPPDVDSTANDEWVNALVNNKKFQLRIANNTLKNGPQKGANTVVGAAKHILNNAAVSQKEGIDISQAARVFDEIVEFPTHFPHLVADCALHILKYAVLFSPETYKSAETRAWNYMVGNTDMNQPIDIRVCAAYIVEHDHGFSREVVMLAIDKLCEDKKRPIKLSIAMALAVVKQNRSFFEKAVFNQEEFVKFYDDQGAKGIIERYSKLSNVLQEEQSQVTVSAQEGFNVFRRSVPINNDKEKRTLVQFYKEPKIGDNQGRFVDIDGQLITVYRLWVEGYFEAAIHASNNKMARYTENRLAEYLINNRKHAAIDLWQNRPTPPLVMDAPLVSMA